MTGKAFFCLVSISSTVWCHEPSLFYNKKASNWKNKKTNNNKKIKCELRFKISLNWIRLRWVSIVGLPRSMSQVLVLVTYICVWGAFQNTVTVAN